MASQPPLTPEIERVLASYLGIQVEERRLKDEKAQLRDALLAHLAGMQGRFWFPAVGGQKLVVTPSRRTAIEYDEVLLRQRLGDRYPRILKPDPKKLRQHLDEIEPHLAPVLSLVGSPHPDRVRAAVLSGVVTKEEFQGAFRKEQKASVTVRRAREGDPGWS